MRILWPFVLFIGLSLAAGAVGSLATFPALHGWYASLAKPSWTPPNAVFGPVWTALYVLMGTAAALVWRSGKPGRALPLWLFVAHLIVNALWSVVFFGLRSTMGGLFVIALLWLAVLWLTTFFRPYSRTAAWLLVPYLLWVTYAATLNAGIVLLNP